MKDDVEGNFIPVKEYEFVLPDGFKIEDAQIFTTKLPVKKSEKKKESVQKKSVEVSAKSIVSEEEGSLEEMFVEEKPEKKQEKAPEKVVKPVNVTKKAAVRPYTAKPSYLNTNIGKTTKEITAEEVQKEQAKEFVVGWLKQADQKRKDSLKEFEKQGKPFKQFDNKLSDEINEIMKKLKSTRSHASKSIKTMKNTLEAKNDLEIVKPELKNNPFLSSVVYKNSPDLKKEGFKMQKLDLKSLYNSVDVLEKWVPVNIVKKSEMGEALISDDEEFVQDIELDEN